MKELSIIIPSRNDKYLQKTVEDILSKIEGDTEVFVGMDGGDFEDFFDLNFNDDRVIPTVAPDPIGQRAMQNNLVKDSTSKYILKCDSHVMFSKGFDVELIKVMDENTIMSPVYLPLDAENWQVAVNLPVSWFGFDPDLITQIDKSKHNSEPISESMCLHGSAWIINRETYWKWNICDETLGSWGKQGTELGIKAFLNGGTCKVNKNCYYAHLERKKETDFPYQRDMQEIKETRDRVDARFKNKSIAPLIVKWGYPVGWTEELVNNLPN